MVNIEMKSISIKDFKKIEEFEYNLSDSSMILVKGPNGSGKSSIFEAMYTCLYGSKTGLKDENVIRNGCSSCQLSLTFLINNEEYRVERTIGKGGKLVVYKGSDLISDKSSLSKSIIENLIPEYIFKMSMLEMKSKNDIKILIKDAISSILDLDSIFENLKSRQNELNSKINDYNKEIDKFQSLLLSYNDSMNRLVNRKDELEVLIDTSSKNITDIENTVSTITIEEIVNLKSNLEKNFNTRYNSIRETYNQQLNQLNDKLNQLNLDKLNLMKSRDNLLNEAKLSKNKLESTYTESSSKINNDINLIKNQIKYKTNEITKLKTQLSIDRCPVCNQIITEETKQKVSNDIQNLQSEIDKLEDSINNLNKQLVDLNIKKNNELEELKQKYTILYNDIEDQIELVTKDMNDINILISNINNEISKIDTNKIYDEIINEMNIDVNMINNVDYYVDLFKKLANYRTNIQNYKSEIEYLTNEMNTLNTNINQTNINIDRIISEKSVLEKEIDIVNYWNDIKLFRSILLTKVSLYINNLLQNKYKFLIKVEFEIGEKDIVIRTTNLNGESVLLDSLSEGELTIASLSIMCAIKDMLNTKYKFNWLFLDEFLDKLDQSNTELVVDFIDKTIEGNKFVVTHNTYALELQYWNDVIDRSVN